MENTKREWKDLKTSEKVAGGGCLIILVFIFLSILGVFGTSSSKQAEVVVKGCEQYETRAKVVSKRFLEDHLEYAGSSHIPGYSESSGVFACEDTVFTFKDWVDAANAFGSKRRVNYIMQVEFLGGEWANMKNWKETSFSFLEE